MLSEAWEINNRWHGSGSGGGEGHWPCEGSTFCHARRPLHALPWPFFPCTPGSPLAATFHHMVSSSHSTVPRTRGESWEQRSLSSWWQINHPCLLWKKVCWSTTMFLNIVSELTVKLLSEPSLWLHSYQWRYRNANANRWNNNRWWKYDSTGPNFIGKRDELRWAPERTFEKHMLQVCHEIFLFYSIC